MEPKTKYHKKVAGLQKKVRSLPAKVKHWTFRNCFDKYAVVSRKTFYCTECGHSWKPDCYLAEVLVSCKCPGCKASLKMKYGELHFEFHDYAAALELHDNFQVVRMLYVTKKCDKGKKARFDFTEVMQHWIDSDGRMTTFSMKCRGLSMYYDQWCYDTSLEIRTMTDNAWKRAEIPPSVIFPTIQIHPWIKRNGFDGDYQEIQPQMLFSLILRDQKAETLLKSGQFDLLRNRDHDPRKSDEYWNSIKICMRNSYFVKNPKDWFDYLDLLAYFGKDLNNEKFVCPIDLAKVHDRYVLKKRRILLQLQKIELAKKIDAENAEYLLQKGKFLDLMFTNGKILVHPLPSVEEFLIEGDELHHCIFTNEYYKKADSLVFSAKINNRRIETVEMSISKLKILQARGLQNKVTKHHSEILALINSNIPKIKKLISAH